MLAQLNNGFFIVGTDTGVGKTTISAALLIMLARSGFTTAAIKPIASGCSLTSSGLRNNDALILQKYATHKAEYEQINPFAFAEPIAPHIAAIKAGIDLTVEKILSKTKNTLPSRDVDYILIEGAGGLYVPINNKETIADLIKAYDYPVILVVGIKVGCINHALLTLECMYNSKIKIAGWIANVIDPEMEYVYENIETIKKRTKLSPLGFVPYQDKVNLNMIACHLQSCPI